MVLRYYSTGGHRERIRMADGALHGRLNRRTVMTRRLPASKSAFFLLIRKGLSDRPAEAFGMYRGWIANMPYVGRVHLTYDVL